METPVTIPPEEPTVAVEILLLVHNPPLVALVNVDPLLNQQLTQTVQPIVRGRVWSDAREQFVQCVVARGCVSDGRIERGQATRA